MNFWILRGGKKEMEEHEKKRAPKVPFWRFLAGLGAAFVLMLLILFALQMIFKFVKGENMLIMNDRQIIQKFVK